jgi:hypothetical protein
VPDAHKLGNAESRGAEHEPERAAKDGDRHDNTALLCILSRRYFSRTLSRRTLRLGWHWAAVC